MGTNVKKYIYIYLGHGNNDDNILMKNFVTFKYSVIEKWLSRHHQNECLVQFECLFCFVSKWRISYKTKVIVEPRHLLLVGCCNSICVSNLVKLEPDVKLTQWFFSTSLDVHQATAFKNDFTNLTVTLNKLRFSIRAQVWKCSKILKRFKITK